MHQIHYIQGKVVNNPKNYEELSLEIIFDDDGNQRQANITTWEWIDEAAAILTQIKDEGISGGVGILEGIPHTIEILENGQSEKIELYIDLSTATFNRDLVIADSIPQKQLDWLTERADGFSFAYLYDIEEITDDDVVFVPYIISSIPNYTDAFLVILTLTFVIVEFKKVITDLTESIAKTAGYISSVSGLIQLIFKILYAIIVIAAIVELVLDMVALLIQKVKYKPSMSVNRQIEAACSYLGVNYKSPILQSGEWAKAHIIPETFSNEYSQSDSRIQGWFKGDTNEQHGYFNGTFGDLLRALKDMFNARILMDNGTLTILPSFNPSTSSTFILPNHYNREFKTNADQINSNNLLSFRYDSSDANTIDKWTGNNVQSTLTPIKVINKELALMKGFNNTQLIFARGIKKTEFTTLEEIADDLLDAVAPVIGGLIKVGNGGIKVINAILKFIEDLNSKLSVIGININLDLPEIEEIEDPKLDELIDNRLGMMNLEKDYFQVPKFVLLDVNDSDDKTKLAASNQTQVNANYLWENFHQSKSFKPSAVSAQRILKEYTNVEMNLTEFQQVLTEGLAKLPNGTVCDVTSCKWNPSDRLATFSIEIRQLYTNNLKETKQIPTGR